MPPGDDAPAMPDAARDAARDARPLDAPPDACSDGDGDGVCDTVDDWPCGVAPQAPATTVVTSPGSATKATLTTISVAGSQVVVATPNQQLAVAFHFAIADTACPGNCVDQLE